MDLYPLSSDKAEFVKANRLQVVLGEFSAFVLTVEAIDERGTVHVARSSRLRTDVAILRQFVSEHNASL